MVASFKLNALLLHWHIFSFLSADLELLDSLSDVSPLVDDFANVVLVVFELFDVLVDLPDEDLDELELLDDLLLYVPFNISFTIFCTRSYLSPRAFRLARSLDDMSYSYFH